MTTAPTIHPDRTEGRGARQRAEGAAERHGPTVAKAGWAAKGVVYALLGLLTLQLAMGDPGGSPDQQGALRSIADESWGTIILVLLAIGLAAYAIGRWLEATVLAEPGKEGLDRARSFGSGLFYAALSVFAVQLVVGSGNSNGSSARQTTADVFGLPGGRWLVGIVGVAFVAAGLYEAWTAYTRRFMEDLDTHEMSPGTHRIAERTGVAGLAARAVVWALVGWFLIQAAVHYDAREAKGLDQALRSLAGEGWGTAVLLAVAVGFIAYAAYSFVHARFRDVG
jgi:Domain of Unknown Function (DUF1206)